MELFGQRMPLFYKTTLLPQLDLLFPSRLIGIQNPPSSIQNKWQYYHRAPSVYLGSELDECIFPDELLPCYESELRFRKTVFGNGLCCVRKTLAVTKFGYRSSTWGNIIDSSLIPSFEF